LRILTLGTGKAIAIVLAFRERLVAGLESAVASEARALELTGHRSIFSAGVASWRRFLQRPSR